MKEKKTIKMVEKKFRTKFCKTMKNREFSSRNWQKNLFGSQFLDFNEIKILKNDKIGEAKV